jgi:hypothetical protein
VAPPSRYLVAVTPGTPDTTETVLAGLAIADDDTTQPIHLPFKILDVPVLTEKLTPVLQGGKLFVLRVKGKDAAVNIEAVVESFKALVDRLQESTEGVKVLWYPTG